MVSWENYKMLFWVVTVILALNMSCCPAMELIQDDIDDLYHKLCPRIFTKGLDGGKIAHLQLLGVYVIQNVSWSDLPVYKHEQENLFIYISKSQKILNVGREGSSNPILFGRLKYFDIERAVSQTDKHPYYSMVEQWFTYDPVNKSHISLSVSDLQLECVDEDFLLCRSEQMAFRGQIPLEMRNISSGKDDQKTWISDVTTIRFYMFDGGFKNMRPVYEVLGLDKVLFLYYNEEEEAWEISGDWIGDSVDKFVVFRVFDTALRPEYITGLWQLYNNDTIADIPDIKLRCRGIAATPDGACVENYPCYNAARCKYVEHTSGSGEIICMCGPNHQGPSCREETPSCPDQSDMDMPDNALLFSSNGKQLGDVTTYFCFPESAEMFFFSKCQSTKSENGTVEIAWVFHGNCDFENSAISTASYSTLAILFASLSIILLFN